MTEPMTAARLDEIASRAAHLYESTHQSEEADVLAGVDVPELVAEVRRLQAVVDAAARCHRRMPLYKWADDCPHAEPAETDDTFEAWDDEHPWAANENDSGRVCLASPIGAECSSCRSDEDGDPVSWPCLTAVALGLAPKPYTGEA